MNDGNLLKGRATQFRSGEEAVKQGRKGGIQRGKNNQKRRAFKEYIENELDKQTTIYGVTITAKEAVCIKLVRLMLDDQISSKDFLRAFEFVRDTVGEKPIEKHAFSEVSQEVIDEVERMVLACEQPKTSPF